MGIVDKLKAIGDAIREKTGSTAKLSLDQMVNEIEAISVGGDTTVEDALIMRTITSYTNPDVTKLKGFCFYNAVDLEELNLPKVTTVGFNALYNCKGLKTANMDGLITTTDGGLFENASALVSVSLANLETITKGSVLRACSSLPSIVLPKLTTVSGSYALGYCTSLEKAEFPSLTTISGGSFMRGCSKLKTLILGYATEPVQMTASAHYAFLDATHLEIYVPDNLVEDYKVATNWTSFASKIKPLSEYVEVTE